MLEYFFDMGETFDSSVLATGDDYDWDRFTYGPKGEQKKIALQGGGLQSIQGIHSVHRDGVTGLRVEFRSPEKIEEMEKKTASEVISWLQENQFLSSVAPRCKGCGKMNQLQESQERIDRKLNKNY